MKFSIGQTVEHILSHDWLLVLGLKTMEDGQVGYECRTKSLEINSFYEYELIEKK